MNQPWSEAQAARRRGRCARRWPSAPAARTRSPPAPRPATRRSRATSCSAAAGRGRVRRQPCRASGPAPPRGLGRDRVDLRGRDCAGPRATAASAGTSPSGPTRPPRRRSRPSSRRHARRSTPSTSQTRKSCATSSARPRCRAGGRGREAARPARGGGQDHRPLELRRPPATVAPAAPTPRKVADPWAALQESMNQGELDLAELEQMKGADVPARRSAVGRARRPVARPDAPCFLFDFWYWWLLATTLTLPPLGILLVLRRRGPPPGPDAVATARHAVGAVQALWPVCQELALASYWRSAWQSRKRNKACCTRPARARRRSSRGFAMPCPGIANGRGGRPASAGAGDQGAQGRPDRDRRHGARGAGRGPGAARRRAARGRPALPEGPRREQPPARAGMDRDAARLEERVRLVREHQPHHGPGVRPGLPAVEQEDQPPGELPLGLPFGSIAMRLEDFEGRRPDRAATAAARSGGAQLSGAAAVPGQGSLLIKAGDDGKAGAVAGAAGAACSAA